MRCAGRSSGRALSACAPRQVSAETPVSENLHGAVLSREGFQRRTAPHGNRRPPIFAQTGAAALCRSCRVSLEIAQNKHVRDASMIEQILAIETTASPRGYAGRVLKGEKPADLLV